MIVFDKLHVECVIGDITEQSDLDAVVNAANAQLQRGGGVAGAIHKAAGPELERACRPHAPIAPGEAVITDAFDLPNRYVVHALGPVYGKDKPEAKLLSLAYENALRQADYAGARSIAFPALSTGAFGYPMKPAAHIAAAAIARIARELESVRLIRFVLLDEKTRAIHEAAFQQAA